MKHLNLNYQVKPRNRADYHRTLNILRARMYERTSLSDLASYHMKRVPNKDYNNPRETHYFVQVVIPRKES